MRAFPVQDASHIAQVRRDVVAIARKLGFDKDGQGRVAIVVTELATNLLKHGGGGTMLVEDQPEFDNPVLDCIAMDKGPGMYDIAACLGDGYSTAGSSGSGLGAVLRQADLVDIYSQPQNGTVLFARLRPGQFGQPGGARNVFTASLFSPGQTSDRATEDGGIDIWGGVCVAKPGEDVCGDNWLVKRRDDGLIAVVVDGLGHGLLAAEAANAAIAVFDQQFQRRPAEIIDAMHGALRSTRGAAVSVMHLDTAARMGHFAGIGNVAATLVSGQSSRRLVSHNGTVGHAMRRVQEIDYPFDMTGGAAATDGQGAIVIMHSDGLGGSCSLDPYPGLAAHHPMTIGAVLYRDFQRGRDDATVLVASVGRHLTGRYG
jgi:anti-sigma regulatory factor (Ser/Thr protein kinase)